MNAHISVDSYTKLPLLPQTWGLRCTSTYGSYDEMDLAKKACSSDDHCMGVSKYDKHTNVNLCSTGSHLYYYSYYNFYQKGTLS